MRLRFASKNVIISFTVVLTFVFASFILFTTVGAAGPQTPLRVGWVIGNTEAGGVSILQNSTYLEPITGNWATMPTNHFRHGGGERTNILCADGHAQSFEADGATIDPETNLGFVGVQNDPHYEQ